TCRASVSREEFEGTCAMEWQGIFKKDSTFIYEYEL
ncbi:hypothetical protein A2U01_0114628, partial [Trifolium medium]|nr:hypothetical protein [Trifolium medium]